VYNIQCAVTGVPMTPMTTWTTASRRNKLRGNPYYTEVGSRDVRVRHFGYPYPTRPVVRYSYPYPGRVHSWVTTYSYTPIQHSFL